MSDYGIEQAPAGPTAAGPGREADEEYRQQRSPYAADLDVAIIGGGIAGLATAVALRRLNSDWQIKVFEQRPAPRDKYGGSCRLEPNGLNAVEALGKGLLRDVVAHATLSKTILMHDTEGNVISRLHERQERNIRQTGKPSMVVGWWEIEHILAAHLPDGCVEYECPLAHMQEQPGEVLLSFQGVGLPVRAQLVVACDGPFSAIRRQLVGDGDPAFDDTVLFVGRLPGDQVATTPIDYDAWWLRPGQAFISHPLADGDVAWEAVVNTSLLRQEQGFRFDEDLRRIVPSGAGGEGKGKGRRLSVPQELLQLFSGFPRAVEQMITNTPPAAILECPIFIRTAKDLPASMGKGRVVVLGNSAHPLRHIGQDENMALEDAAELGAAVMQFGLSKEALRRFEQRRRPRWKHVMQVTMAQGMTTNLSIGLRQGVLDYTSDLHKKQFARLRPLAGWKAGVKELARRAGPLGAALLLYGLASGAWLAARALRGGGASSSSEGGGDFVEQLGKLVGGAADSVQGALHEVVPGMVPGVTYDEEEQAPSRRRRREQRLAEELPSESDTRLVPGGEERRGAVAAVASKASHAALAVPKKVGGRVAGSVAGGVVRLAWGRLARALGAF